MPPASGDVKARRDINARDIVTGLQYVAQQNNLAINIIVPDVERLVELLGRPETTFLPLGAAPASAASLEAWLDMARLELERSEEAQFLDPLRAERTDPARLKQRLERDIAERQARLEALRAAMDRFDSASAGQVQANDCQAATADGPILAAAPGEALLLPNALVTAFRALADLPDQDDRLRWHAYAMWLVMRQMKYTPQLEAARQHYVPLRGYTDFRDVPLTFSERKIEGEGPNRTINRKELSDVTEAVEQHPAFVLLGAPGSGKTTVLHRLAIDCAQRYLRGEDSRLPLLITLADYRWESERPIEAVSRRWAEQAPGSFVEMTREGRVLLLADGLNEMLTLTGRDEPRRRANDWQRFLEEHFSDPNNRSRAVFASRHEADYAQPLGLPRVEIDPLNDAQIAEFLQVYLGDGWQGALEAIRRLDLWEHARVPYRLAVLTDLYDPRTGDLPPNQGLLFAEYARRLVLGEAHAGHPGYDTDATLAALGELGYAMQAQEGTTILPAARMRELLPTRVSVPGRPAPLDVVPEDLFYLARCAGILVPEPMASTVAEAHKFSHQLLQEQFAARALLARWERGEDLRALWRTARTHAEMPPPGDGEWDSLPFPPPTRWEQTTLLAAGMLPEADAFVGAVLAVNPALAGRCLSDGRATVSAGTRGAVQQALLADLGNPALHRRTRIEAGHVLARPGVGDPRFTPIEIDGVRVILPDLVAVEGGRATVGSRRWPFDRMAYPDERPRHRVDVQSFLLGRYPVTRAEYTCFIEAGGYDNPDWWQRAPDAWRWRQGELAASGPVEDLMAFRAWLRARPGEIERRLRSKNWNPETARFWRDRLNESDDQARQVFTRRYPAGSHDRPWGWDDPAYSVASQPVIGVTWYEALAYCAWLEAQLAALRRRAGVELPAGPLGDLLRAAPVAVRLPSEVEWEWAAGGPDHTRYTWRGGFDPDRANTLEGRVRRPTPVGAYRGGVAACGAHDMCGNVWEWTASAYGRYPCVPGAGHESPAAEAQRVLRGGSFHLNQRLARVSCRSNARPDSFTNFIGFRVVVAPVSSG